MTAQETALLLSLRELEALAAAMPTANPKPDLRPVFRRIEELGSGLPAETDAQLRHYLSRQSWQKARQWLEDQGGAAPAPHPSPAGR